jgi:hypothetical protein
VSTLSVETSSSGSSASTVSPSCFSHWVTVPSLTLSPKFGMVTGVAAPASATGAAGSVRASAAGCGAGSGSGSGWAAGSAAVSGAG